MLRVEGQDLEELRWVSAWIFSYFEGDGESSETTCAKDKSKLIWIGMDNRTCWRCMKPSIGVLLGLSVEQGKPQVPTSVSSYFVS